MKNIKLIIISGMALIIAAILTGCASTNLRHMEQDTVSGPRQVRQGLGIDPRSITVWGIYRNGDRKIVSLNSGNINFNRHTPGLQTVKIRVGSRQEVSFVTEVMALRSMSIVSPPRTVLFKAGEVPSSSWPGLEIWGEWDQMGSQRINISDCTITGYMKDQPGRQTIRVMFGGLSDTFEVDVRGMTGIQIVQHPTKIDYFLNEPLNLTGLRVVGLWEGFPSEVLQITMDDVTGYSRNNVGIQRITITKDGRSTYFNVEVMALTSIEMEKPPTKVDYKRGEPLDLTGILVMGHYTGANVSKRMSGLIPVEQLTVDGLDPNRVGRQQRIRVSIMGQSASFFVNIE